MRARIIRKSSAARGRARSRRSSSIRARIIGKSSAARGRVTFSPFSCDAGVITGSLRFTYKGIPMVKDPFDLALYSMLLWNTKPKTIIEIGSLRGGSALWLCDTAAAMGLDCKVISIDTRPPTGIAGPEFLRGDARKLEVNFYKMARPLLVIEDSDHEPETVLSVLKYFDHSMQSGEYIVVEDGIASVLHPERYPSGPLAAIDSFLEESGDRWEVDRRYCDFFGHNLTWNPNGYLRRK
jgi:cephalosporin hydroxylase